MAKGVNVYGAKCGKEHSACPACGSCHDPISDNRATAQHSKRAHPGDAEDAGRHQVHAARGVVRARARRLEKRGSNHEPDALRDALHEGIREIFR